MPPETRTRKTKPIGLLSYPLNSETKLRGYQDMGEISECHLNQK